MEGGVSPRRGTAIFRPRARLIRLIGNELISDEIMAVVELVKNSYDADSRAVTISLSADTEEQDRSLTVQDDGDGMDLETVLHSWLEPATDRKRRGGRKQRTPLGRYPLGEKGVGRFAADKLGDCMELVTRARGQEEEIALSVHWDRFGETGYLDEVETEWEVRVPQVFIGQQHGTRIRATGLRGEWDETRLGKLREGLSRLVSPGAGTTDFTVYLQAPDFPQLEGSVRNELVDNAPYRIAGEIDARGIFHESGESGSAIDLKPLAGDHFLEAGQWRMPACGKFRVAFSAWDLDVPGSGRTVVLDRSTRSWLRRTSGVSLYRDGFRVWPYGSPGDDWLELNYRRVNNPTLRLSTNQIVGVVEVTQEDNPDLRDRTSREGLIDTPAFHDLRALLIAVLSRLEERRFAHRQKERLLTDVSTNTDPILIALTTIRDGDTGVRGHRKLIDGVISEYRRQTAHQRAVTNRLVQLAGIGLSVEQIASEIRSTIGLTSTGLTIAKNRVSSTDVPAEVRDLVQRLGDHLDFIGQQMDAVGTLLGNDEPENGKEGRYCDLREVLQTVIPLFEFRRRTGSVRVSYSVEHDFRAAIPRRDLMQILVHLFDNALYWTERPGGSPDREIQIRSLKEESGFIFADSGPGIAQEVADRVFDLYFSRRSDSRGMGLHLVRAILEENGGSIELLSERVLLPGANFRISLPQRPSRRKYELPHH